MALAWLLNLNFGGSDPGGPAFSPVWLQYSNQEGQSAMLRKNTGGQVIGAQLIDTNGDAQTTGTTTVHVTGDGGAQASGGTATHEGNGYWSFTPSQANTNYNQVAFTFVSDDTDCIPVTKEYLTVAFNPADAVRMGLTALPNAAADGVGGLPISDAGGLDMDAILADTNELQGDWVNGGRLDLLIDAILADTNELQGDWADTGRLDAILDARASQASVDTVDGNVDTILVDTNELQTDWTNGGRLDLILDAVLAMLDDARAEPGQGAPPVNPDAMTKLDYLYKSWRNKKDNDGSTTQLYNDAGDTVDQKQATSEAAGTVTKAEWATGP